MNLSQFFQHWNIAENPFRGEEARHDGVFARMSEPVPGSPATAAHSDFEKILGDVARPSTSIVFGEKGSGKTAIRMQIAAAVQRHNAANPGRGILLLPYDDLNALLDAFHESSSEKDPADSFRKLRLTDHVDGLLATAVATIVPALLGPTEQAKRLLGDDQAPRRLRHATREARCEALLLQAIYDRGDGAAIRTARLRRKLALGPTRRSVINALITVLGPLPAAGAFYLWLNAGLEGWQQDAALYAFMALAAVYLVALAKIYLWDRFMLLRLGRRLRKQIRVLPRSDASYASSLERLDAPWRGPDVLPVDASDDTRYALLDRLRRVAAALGFPGIIVVVDRVDEPTLVSGDPDRMRAIIWPMLNNKFLQQEGLGFKLLLPVDLRYALFKESAAFFQEARLDKQNLVERLSWTGAMLYDLCDARLRACRPDNADPMTLLDLFAEDVSRQDLVDALDQMHQPRDAFKFLYHCLTEHCSNVTAEQNEWRIPRLVLEQVRKREVDRLQQLYRGIRPA